MSAVVVHSFDSVDFGFRIEERRDVALEDDNRYLEIKIRMPRGARGEKALRQIDKLLEVVAHETIGSKEASHLRERLGRGLDALFEPLGKRPSWDSPEATGETILADIKDLSASLWEKPAILQTETIEVTLSEARALLGVVWSDGRADSQLLLAVNGILQALEREESRRREVRCKVESLRLSYDIGRDPTPEDVLSLLEYLGRAL